MLRFLLWRLLGLLALLIGFALVAWCLDGGVGRSLRGGQARLSPGRLLADGWNLLGRASGVCSAVTAPLAGVAIVLLALSALSIGSRWIARDRRRYVRLRIEPHRTDSATAESLVTLFEVVHKRILRRWWRRMMLGQPAIALEIHHRVQRTPDGGAIGAAWMALSGPIGCERVLESALRTAYPNCRLMASAEPLARVGSLLRLKKDVEFIKRVGDGRRTAPPGRQRRRRSGAVSRPARRWQGAGHRQRARRPRRRGRRA